MESRRACGQLYHEMQPVMVEDLINIVSSEEKRLFREMAHHSFQVCREVFLLIWFGYARFLHMLRCFQAVASTNALLDHHRRQLRKVVAKGEEDLALEKHRAEVLEREVADLT